MSRWLLLALLAAGPAWAEPPADLYQAVVIVTGTDLRSRPAGFARALTEVMVKVAGEPHLARDPRVAKLAADPGRLISAFNYADQMAGTRVHDDQGTYDRSYDLTVHFDKARVDAALRELGAPPWTGGRPVIEPLLRIEGASGPPRPFSVDDPALAVQRASFARSGAVFGMAVRVPSDADLAAWSVAGDGSAPALPDRIVVSGAIAFRQVEPFGWAGSFHAVWRGAAHEWSVEGVSYDAAFDALVRGALRIASGHDAPD